MAKDQSPGSDKPAVKAAPSAVTLEQLAAINDGGGRTYNPETGELALTKKPPRMMPPGKERDAALAAAAKARAERQ